MIVKTGQFLQPWNGACWGTLRRWRLTWISGAGLQALERWNYVAFASMINKFDQAVSQGKQRLQCPVPVTQVTHQGQELHAELANSLRHQCALGNAAMLTINLPDKKSHNAFVVTDSEQLLRKAMGNVRQSWISFWHPYPGPHAHHDVTRSCTAYINAACTLQAHIRWAWLLTARVSIAVFPWNDEMKTHYRQLGRRGGA